MINKVDLLFICKCFSVLLTDGKLMHVYAEKYIIDDEYNVYYFQISDISVCILPVESVVNIVED